MPPMCSLFPAGLLTLEMLQPAGTVTQATRQLLLEMLFPLSLPFCCFPTPFLKAFFPHLSLRATFHQGPSHKGTHTAQELRTLHRTPTLLTAPGTPQYSDTVCGDWEWGWASPIPSGCSCAGQVSSIGGNEPWSAEGHRAIAKGNRGHTGAMHVARGV